MRRPAWTRDALALLARLRFATARMVASRLALDESEVTALFDALAVEGALRVLRQSTLAGDGLAPPAPAYAPTLTGLALAGIDPEHARPRVTRTLTSTVSLAHELVVNETALVLELLDARGALRLLHWETRRERLADVSFVAERGRAIRVPLVADALAVVEIHGRRHGFVIEVDMGTVGAATMRRKYAGYVSWWSDGGPTRRYGLPATRVVTIAPAPRRLERLHTLALDATSGRGTGLLWFLPQSAVDVMAPERFLDPVARVAKPTEPDPLPLLPP